jgi:hypothetical protein
MAYEDLPSQAWRNLPPAQWNTGLLGQGQAPAPTNYYQQIMQEMASQPMYATVAPQSAGGYKTGIYAPRTVDEMVDELNALNAAGGRGGGRSAAEQQRIDQFFDAMTPTELAEFQKKNADFINKLLTPLPLQLADLAAKKLGYKGFLPYTLGGDIFTKEKTPVVTVGEGTLSNTGGNTIGTVSPTGAITGDGGLLGDGKQGVVTVGEGEAVADGDGITAPSYGVISGGGLLGLSGISGPGVASTTPGNAVSSAMGGQAAAAGVTSSIAPGATAASLGLHGAGGGGGGGGGGSSSGVASGSGGGAAAMGTGAGGMAAGAGTSSGGGGGGGGGGGCCFIMLEARYGDGTMDRVVRRYRDEKVTEKNKRGYYKLAEVFIPLMRKSKLFSFFVVKTFADPAVCYAKWYYGENKWGWIFKPLERFWMKLFDTLGTDTKFIRENGETV